MSVVWNGYRQGRDVYNLVVMCACSIDGQLEMRNERIRKRTWSEVRPWERFRCHLRIPLRRIHGLSNTKFCTEHCRRLWTWLNLLPRRWTTVMVWRQRFLAYINSNRISFYGYRLKLGINSNSVRTQQRMNETVAAIRLHIRHHDPYEDWVKQTRKDAFVRKIHNHLSSPS